MRADQVIACRGGGGGGGGGGGERIASQHFEHIFICQIRKKAICVDFLWLLQCQCTRKYVRSKQLSLKVKFAEWRDGQKDGHKRWTRLCTCMYTVGTCVRKVCRLLLLLLVSHVKQKYVTYIYLLTYLLLLVYLCRRCYTVYYFSSCRVGIF